MYPWFETISRSTELVQGDMVINCAVIQPTPDHYKAIEQNLESELPCPVLLFNGIILSQSCDIVNEKIHSVIVCPVITLGELMQNEPYFHSSTARESLRQGKEPAYHLLNKVSITTSSLEDFYVVTFRHIYSIPKDFIKATVEGQSRMRLLPPYREHLSQSFARYFMRVGLPVDISKDDIKSFVHTQPDTN